MGSKYTRTGWQCTASDDVCSAGRAHETRNSLMLRHLDTARDRQWRMRIRSFVVSDWEALSRLGAQLAGVCHCRHRLPAQRLRGVGGADVSDKRPPLLDPDRQIWPSRYNVHTVTIDSLTGESGSEPSHYRQYE
jgi:hypothetical protein